MVDARAVTLLLVEDDPGHALLIERNLRRAHITNTILSFRDGYTAVEYLFGEGLQRPRSLLVLLDLNLPGLNGFQILERLKTDARTKHIPVICLTTTDHPADVERCYTLGCNIFITKPIAYDEFIAAVQRLGLILTIAQIPHGGPTP
jgi:CheY-like chemotaxis protein